MARSLISLRTINANVGVVPGASVLMLDEDGSAFSQTIYAETTGGATLSNPLTSDTYGLIEAYVDVPQRAIARVTARGETAETILDLEPDPSSIVGLPISGGTVTGAAISGGTVAGAAISGGTVTGAAISGGTASGAAISGGTVTGAAITATNAALTTPTITGGTISGGTISGAAITATNADINTPDIDGGTIDGAAITATNAVLTTADINNPDIDGGTIDGAAITATNAVLTTADINTPDIDGGTIDGTAITGGTLTGTTLVGVSVTLDVADPTVTGITVTGAAADAIEATTGGATLAGRLTASSAVITSNGPIVPANVSGIPTPNGLFQENVVKACGYLASNGTVLFGFNIASVSHPSAGRYVVTLLRAFTDANYLVVSSPQGVGISQPIAKTSSTIEIKTYTVAGVETDNPVNFMAIGNQ